MKKLLFILIILCSLQGFGQTTGAKGVWRMNGNSNDASGNGNNGTDTNITYSQANGRIGQGAGFNGNSKITIAGNSTNSISGTITVSCWINITTMPSNNQSAAIISKAMVSSSAVGYQLIITNDAGAIGILFGSYSAVSVNYYTRTKQTYSTGVWYHIVGTYNGSTWNLYLNGLKQTRTDGNDGTGAIASTNDINIGYFSSNGVIQRYYTGKIDEVIIDNTAWSAARVKNEYSKAKGFF